MVIWTNGSIIEVIWTNGSIIRLTYLKEYLEFVYVDQGFDHRGCWSGFGSVHLISDPYLFRVVSNPTQNPNRF